jgi:hypothetical protein
MAQIMDKITNVFKIKQLKINLGQVPFILESKASAFGTHTTVPSQLLMTKKKRLKLKLWTPKFQFLIRI